MTDSQPVLTIAIPTYNRPHDIARTIGALAGQLGDATRIIIIDNCSAEPVEATLEPFVRGFPGKIQVFRNRVNIGANANILRCLEYSETPFVWLLSDDDLPTADGVEIVHRQIGKDPDCAFWKFSSAQHPFQNERRAATAAEFLEFVGPFSQAIWMSNGVFNLPKVLPFFASASHWLSSCAAHLLLVLLALEHDNAATISTETIVEIKPPDEGQSLELAAVFAGFPLLLEAPLKWKTKQLLGRMIGGMFGSPEGLAIRVTQTANEVWCYDEKVYHFRNLGNAIFRCFGTPAQKWRYALLERSLALVQMAGNADHSFTGGKFLSRPALSRPAQWKRL